MQPTPTTQLDKLSGIVERVTFHSDETGWSVLKVKPFGAPNTLETVTVHQAKVFAGASMDFFGEWSEHPKFGRQFKALNIVEQKPASSAALEKYLGSGLIKGVGPKTAKKIVKHFGKRTLEVFENTIDDLLSVPTIAQKKLESIKTSWEEHKSIRDVMIFLQGHGVSTLFAVKIFKQYGNNAISTVQENPYKLSRDIYGIGFFSADKIALSIGIPRDGAARISAGIKHILDSAREDGHCYLLKEQVIDGVNTLLELSNEKIISEIIIEMIARNEIKKRVINILEQNIVNNECFYAPSLFFDEINSVKKIKQLQQSRHNVSTDLVTKLVNNYCQKESITLSDEQIKSVIQIPQYGVSVLTGGPGCGKTTTTKVLVKTLKALGKNIALAAPTGRAAKRMSEVIGTEAKTLHRMLEWNPTSGGFKKNDTNHLPNDFVIIDEASMLDISLISSLLKALSPNCQLLLIGDPDQLPSVGAGQVLKDILDSKVVPTFHLNKIFRQAAKSKIIQFAHELNRGETPNIPSPISNAKFWSDGTDCFFIDSEEATKEQLKFISKVKHFLGNNIDGRNDIENEEPFSIPEKFKHVDLEKIILATTPINELKAVLKKIPPHSTLHYGHGAVETILRLYSKTIHEKFSNDIEIQILSPQIRGSLGTANLNKTIQEKVNPYSPNKSQLMLGDKIFRVGDRVIQIRNNYDLLTFNGDIGQIIHLDIEEQTCTVKFNDDHRCVEYKRENLNELNLAYAITVHKSQGSEFGAVIIPVTSQHFKMLFRNIIYTGLTRAKKVAIFVGSRKAMAMAIRTVDSKSRQTTLKILLQESGTFQ